MLHRRLTQTAIAFLCLFASSAAFSLNIYMAPPPEGSRFAAGTRDDPTNSLERVLELATDQFLIEPTDIHVVIGPGTYAGERIDWDLAHDDLIITFAAKDPDDRPVFDGEGLVNLFFSYHNQPDVTRTNFIFDNLVIKNYAVAIQLGYLRDSGVNSNNIVQNCLFQNLGERFSVGPAIGAIGLQYSHSNIITNNQFINTINDPATPEEKTAPGQKRRLGSSHFHTIYVVHSSNNRITKNLFKSYDRGGAIDIRDFSNNNIISRNEFDNSDYPFGQKHAIVEWYCNTGLQKSCVDAGHFEDYSYGNLIYYNRYKSVGKLFEETPRTNTVGQTDTPSCVVNDSCETPPAEFRRIIRQNVDVTEGTCYFRILGEACKRMNRFAHTLYVDYMSELAHRSAEYCGLRKASWEASCTRDSPDIDLQVEMIYMTIAPGIPGTEFAVESEGEETLIMRDAQQEYVFEALAPGRE
jgi:hypothetical protein